MTLNDLLIKISTSGSKNIEVQHLKVAHGNPGGAGDYRLITLSIDGEVLRFKETPSGWQPE